MAVEIKKAVFEMRKVLGEIPILASEQRLLDEAEAADETSTEKQPEQPKATTTTRVLADGTYATETVYSSAAATARLELVRAAAKPPLRALILGGDFFTGSVLASTLTKLVLRYSETQSDSQDVNSLRAEALLIMTSVIRVGQSKFAAVPIDEDSQERIMNCIETLAQLQGSKAVKQVFLEDTKSAYARMVATEEASLATLGRDRMLTVTEKGAGKEGGRHTGNWDTSRRPHLLPSIIQKGCRW